MPIERVPGKDVTYYLITFDEDGRERTDDPDGLMSQQIVAALKEQSVTDIFLFSHGWKGDIPAAREQYNRWIGTMVSCTTDWDRASSVRPGFKPLFIGLHWPSLPWGDEEFGSPGVSFVPTGAPDIELLVERYAQRIACTDKAREALRTIFTAALQDVAPATLPQEVRTAYDILNCESGMESKGEGAAPGQDREPFDPEMAYQNSQQQVSFGGIDLGGILAPLRQLSFWKMKDRARQFGESGGAGFLSSLQTATESNTLRIHLMGHSFGCIVVSAMLAGPAGQGKMVRAVNSLVLVQGALSIWSYCASLPFEKGKCGYFNTIVSDRRVKGPIVTTQSCHDTAVGSYYPIAAGLAGQVSFVPGELPKYGALGAFGARGEGLAIKDITMVPADSLYRFEPGALYNIESSVFISKMEGSSGAHSDIAHAEVAHVIWEAALS